MPRYTAIIGANYGDEGKGLFTDYFAANRTTRDGLVVRHNGGAQAGHTVQLQGGHRHVFHHFGSGTFADADTYLGPEFILNPISFKEERELLVRHGRLPIVSIHPDAIVTLPYDMMINQFVERARDKTAEGRHGSCGLGINETVTRYVKYREARVTAMDLKDYRRIRRIMVMEREEGAQQRLAELGFPDLWNEHRDTFMNDGVMEQFLNDCFTMATQTSVTSLSYVAQNRDVIFEGAQGLRLDQNSPDFPHVTRSNTGLKNIRDLIDGDFQIPELQVVYLTRPYLTRHGVGPLPREVEWDAMPIIDATNQPNQWQGRLRFAPLDLNDVADFVNGDLHRQLPCPVTATFGVSCADHAPSFTVYEGDTPTKLKPEEIAWRLVEMIDYHSYTRDPYLSAGPTRKDIIALN